MKTITKMSAFAAIEATELLLEIMAGGNDLTIEDKTPLPGVGKPAPVARVHRFSVYGPGLGSGLASDNGLLPSLRFFVDTIRAAHGQPSREETANAAQAEDEHHAAQPPVEIGPDACCSCGSKRPLIVERNIKAQVYWDTGEVVYRGSLWLPDVPGELATCQDCGKSYQLGQA